MTEEFTFEQIASIMCISNTRAYQLYQESIAELRKTIKRGSMISKSLIALIEKNLRALSQKRPKDCMFITSHDATPEHNECFDFYIVIGGKAAYIVVMGMVTERGYIHVGGDWEHEYANNLPRIVWELFKRKMKPEVMLEAQLLQFNAILAKELRKL